MNAGARLYKTRHTNIKNTNFKDLIRLISPLLKKKAPKAKDTLVLSTLTSD